MAKLRELGFRLSSTSINRYSIDQLIAFTDAHDKNIHSSMVSFLKGKAYDSAALNAISHYEELEFSLYALAIVHCYSILENNRKQILLKGGFPPNKVKSLHKIEIVDKALKSMGIVHEKMRCYKTMDEFRQVNNAIKHERLGRSRSVTTSKSKKTYTAKQLKALYLSKSKYLDSYLANLYKRIVAPTLNK